MKRIIEVASIQEFDTVEGPPYDVALRIPREGLHVYIKWEDDNGDTGTDHYISFLKPNTEAGK